MTFGVGRTNILMQNRKLSFLFSLCQRVCVLRRTLYLTVLKILSLYSQHHHSLFMWSTMSHQVMIYFFLFFFGILYILLHVLTADANIEASYLIYRLFKQLVCPFLTSTHPPLASLYKGGRTKRGPVCTLPILSLLKINWGGIQLQATGCC